MRVRQQVQASPKAAHCLGHCCRKSLATLRFEVDGEDLTGADARLTQAAIERRLAVGLLARASFHGQADITALLEVPSRAPCDAVHSAVSSYCLRIRLTRRPHQAGSYKCHLAITSSLVQCTCLVVVWQQQSPCFRASSRPLHRDFWNKTCSLANMPTLGGLSKWCLNPCS